MNKPKYTNLSAFIKGVQRVNEHLTDGERLMMFALAGSVDYKTGRSRPGNEELQRVAGRKWSAVHNILRSLNKGKRLIEIAEMGNGRGYATVYRFRTEDDRYPEPGKKKPYTSECIDNSKEAYTSECTLPEKNHTLEDEKPSSPSEETVHLGAGNHPVAVNNTSYKDLPKTTSTTPSQNSKPLGEDGFVSNSNATPTGKEESGDSIPDNIKKEIDELREAFKHVTKNEYGAHELSVTDAESILCCKFPALAVGHAWELLYNREKGWGGLSSPQVIFVREFRAEWKKTMQDIAEEEKQKEKLADAQRQIERSRIQGQKKAAALYAEIQAEEQEIPLSASGEIQF